MTFRERLLLRRLRERDERAFRELVEEYQDRVFNLLYRMIGGREEAEDLAQEVFVTVFKSIEQFRGESKLSTWLYRVAVNHCKNRIKYLVRRHDRKTGTLDDAADRVAAHRARARGLRLEVEGLRLHGHAVLDRPDQHRRAAANRHP